MAGGTIREKRAWLCQEMETEELRRKLEVVEVIFLLMGPSTIFVHRSHRSLNYIELPFSACWD